MLFRSAYLHEAGRLVGVELERMELGEPDASGRRRPVPVKGGSFTLDVDTVLTAIGEEPALDAVPEEVSRHAGAIRVDAVGATGITTFFAAGDAAGAERTVADALGSGKRAAIGIDRYLRWVAGERVRWGEVSELQWAGGGVSISRWYGDDPVRRTNPTDEVIDVAALQLAHFAPAERHPDRFREGELDFSEVNLGLDLEAAVAEARRCFNCGVCNECELCLIFCPDVAIRRHPAGGFEIDSDHCKGCGLCAEECPRGAIVMTREAL